MKTNRLPIYYWFAPNLYLLSATFMRFQEHYESPRFRGQVFTWEEYMDWYAAENGAFSYFEDWEGFNFPDGVLDAFRRGDFDPLTRKERALLDALDGIPQPFYVLGAERGHEGTLAHEFVHAVYYLDDAYRRAVDAELKRFGSILPPVRRVLIGLGYHRSVLNDEFNAYLVDDPDDHFDKLDLSKPQKALRSVFRQHFGCRVWNRSEAALLWKRCHRLTVKW